MAYGQEKKGDATDHTEYPGRPNNAPKHPVKTSKKKKKKIVVAGHNYPTGTKGSQ